jgi:hypothetical protein
VHAVAGTKDARLSVRQAYDAIAADYDAQVRGVHYLLQTQQEDGSWYVKTRALAFQPYFEADFPYGFDQWISAAGTSWATMALALAAPPSTSAAVAQLR